MKRSHLQIAFYMLAVFLSGTVVGGFAHKLYVVKSVDAAPPRNSEEFRKRYVEELQRQLGLDAGQAANLNGILDRTSARFKEFRDSHRAETENIHAEQVSEIRAMLSPEQQTKYADFLEGREKRRKQDGGKR